MWILGFTYVRICLFLVMQKYNVLCYCARKMQWNVILWCVFLVSRPLGETKFLLVFVVSVSRENHISLFFSNRNDISRALCGGSSH